MSDPDINRRFDRLEVKIDRLTEVLTSIAVVEEQINGQNARLKRHEFRLDENEKKIEDVAETLATNSQVLKVGQGVVASIWAAILASVMYYFNGEP
jgi:septal ring factor EnvC (AmiA/AmiB activator)